MGSLPILKSPVNSKIRFRHRSRSLSSAGARTTGARTKVKSSLLDDVVEAPFDLKGKRVALYFAAGEAPLVRCDLE